MPKVNTQQDDILTMIDSYRYSLLSCRFHSYELEKEDNVKILQTRLLINYVLPLNTLVFVARWTVAIMKITVVAMKTYIRFRMLTSDGNVELTELIRFCTSLIDVWSVKFNESICSSSHFSSDIES